MKKGFKKKIDKKLNMHGGRRDRGQESEHSRTPTAATWLLSLCTSAPLLFYHSSSVHQF